jgi:HNH endonuclease
MAYRGDNATPRERFDEKVGPPDENGCTLWLAGTHANGPRAYGLFYARGQMRPAHRWIYEETYGEQPAHIDVCHRCDVRLCVNLDHLFAGTRQDNMDDAVRKGRTARGPRQSMQGSNHPGSTLSDEQVKAIRKRHDEGAKKRALSEEYGVSFQSISRIVRRISWSHI